VISRSYWPVFATVKPLPAACQGRGEKRYRNQFRACQVVAVQLRAVDLRPASEMVDHSRGHLKLGTPILPVLFTVSGGTPAPQTESTSAHLMVARIVTTFVEDLASRAYRLRRRR
jgi:hypothetical protein